MIPNFLHQAQPSHFIDHNQERFVTTRAGWNVVGTLVHLVAWENLRGTTRSHNERIVFLFRTWEPCIFPDSLKSQQVRQVFVGEIYVVHLETDPTEFTEKGLGFKVRFTQQPVVFTPTNSRKFPQMFVLHVEKQVDMLELFFDLAWSGHANAIYTNLL